MSFLRRLSILTEGLRPSAPTSTNIGGMEVFAHTTDAGIVAFPNADNPISLATNDETLLSTTIEPTAITATPSDRYDEIVVI